jgi:hypothetical protein
VGLARFGHDAGTMQVTEACAIGSIRSAGHDARLVAWRDGDLAASIRTRQHDDLRMRAQQLEIGGKRARRRGR